jgi:hypothetical protein
VPLVAISHRMARLVIIGADDGFHKFYIPQQPLISSFVEYKVIQEPNEICDATNITFLKFNQNIFVE